QLVTTSPPPRSLHALAYDSARARTLLFGGRDAIYAPLGDTWEYDGSIWRRVAPRAAPTPRYGHAVVYDPTRARTLLFSGLAPGAAADTWEYDGSTWSPVVTAASARQRRLHALAYDEGRDRVVLFGGFGDDFLGDTWELQRPAVPTCARHGVGCAGSNGTPSLDAAPGSLPALGS